MAAAHHNLPGPLVQQILEARPPLAEQIRQDPQNREFTEQGWEPVLFGVASCSYCGDWSGAWACRAGEPHPVE